MWKPKSGPLAIPHSLGKLHELIFATRNDDRVGRMSNDPLFLGDSGFVISVQTDDLYSPPGALGFRRAPRAAPQKLSKLIVGGLSG